MNKNLDETTNNELKIYIKENRHNEQACHEAIKRLMNRRSADTPQYSYDISTEEMETIFKAKLQSLSIIRLIVTNIITPIGNEMHPRRWL